MEAWVISYADMVTLLFALFVVLYAIGQTDLKKLRQLKKSIAFAFSYDGNGKTQDLGKFDDGQKQEGKVLDAPPLLVAQKKAMEKLIQRIMKDVEKTPGNSLKVIQTNDTLSVVGPVSMYFQPGSTRLKDSRVMQETLRELMDQVGSQFEKVKLRIDTPNVVVRRTRRGYLRSNEVCWNRLFELQKVLYNRFQIGFDRVPIELYHIGDTALPPGHYAERGWEDRATLSISFTNHE